MDRAAVGSASGLMNLQTRLMEYLLHEHNTTYLHSYDTDGRTVILEVSKFGIFGTGPSYPAAIQDLVARLEAAGYALPTASEEEQ